ncbi:MAG: hypothetical protein K0S45_816 [Nitrospira sp.]|nr:hypothetical protein [Nitrospira sp.]
MFMIVPVADIIVSLLLEVFYPVGDAATPSRPLPWRLSNASKRIFVTFKTMMGEA